MYMIGARTVRKHKQREFHRNCVATYKVSNMLSVVGEIDANVLVAFMVMHSLNPKKEEHCGFKKDSSCAEGFSIVRKL